MSLQETKELLSIDQKNILICDVVQDFDAYATVRTPDGKQVRAGKSQGQSFPVGSQVEVRTDKRIYTVIGVSDYADYAAERYYSL